MGCSNSKPDAQGPSGRSLQSTKSVRIKNTDKAVVLGRMLSQPDINFGFTDEQVEEFRRAFDHFDADGSGDLSISEICAVIEDQGIQMTESELTQVVDEIDVDGNGTVDFREFLFAMSKTEAHREKVAFMQNTVQRVMKLQREMLPIFLPFKQDDPRFKESELQRQQVVRDMVAETEGDEQERAFKKSASRAAIYANKHKRQSKLALVNNNADEPLPPSDPAAPPPPADDSGRGVISAQEAFRLNPICEGNEGDHSTYTTFDSNCMRVYYPQATTILSDREQTFCLLVSKTIGDATLSVVDENFDSIANLGRLPEYDTDTHMCLFRDALIPHNPGKVYIAAKIPVGDQLRFDVYMHFETESPVNFLSRTASPEAAREAMVKAEQQGDWETVVIQAKVLLSLLENAEAPVVLTLAKAHEQLSQYAMAIKAADMILAPGSTLKSDEKALREAYHIKCNCLRVRGFFDECLAVSKAGLAKFPDDECLLSARKASEGVAENEATNPHRWDKADKAALNLPFGEYTVPELAKCLTETLTTDADKIRAIYRWICENIEYDVENLRYGSAEAETTPESVLDNRLGICEGYSRLFAAMCEVVDCEAVCIVGWARSGLVNMAALKVPNHMWNAFKLDGNWYLTDLTWSAGSINPDFTFKQEFNGFFFMTDLNHFANSHYSEDPKWLLVPEFPKETFATTLYLTSHMYRLGIKTISHPDAVINAKEGEIVRIELKQGPETDRVFLHPQAKVWGGVQPVAWDTHSVWDAKNRTHTIVVDTSGSRGAVNLSVFYSAEEVGTYSTLLAYKMVVKS